MAFNRGRSISEGLQQVYGGGTTCSDNEADNKESNCPVKSPLTAAMTLPLVSNENMREIIESGQVMATGLADPTTTLCAYPAEHRLEKQTKYTLSNSHSSGEADTPALDLLSFAAVAKLQK